jgi:probable F420-dependent oxidoreductase
MRFTLLYPLPVVRDRSPFANAEAVAEVTRHADAAAFSAIAFTEHPAPPGDWLERGGHESFDPLVALGYCAAVSPSLRLMTFLLVLPYHRPLMAAKSAASVDVLSDGRLTVVAGAGYLESEFLSLGVRFEERNQMFDEALLQLRAAWTEDAVGEHRAQLVPRPIQPSGPPIWIGGGTPLARRRAAILGDGWSPNLYHADRSTDVRYRLNSLEALERAIREVSQLRGEAGLTGVFDIQVMDLSSRATIPSRSEVRSHVARLRQLASMGVTWYVVQPPMDARNLREGLDAVDRYGTEIISTLD